MDNRELTGTWEPLRFPRRVPEEAYRRTRKDGAAGIDDVTGKEYAENLHDNLQHLLDRLKTGTYPLPIPKIVHSVFKGK